jgi:hypothetical protein
VRLEGIVRAKPNVRLKNRVDDDFFLKYGTCATNWVAGVEAALKAGTASEQTRARKGLFE